VCENVGWEGLLFGGSEELVFWFRFLVGMSSREGMEKRERTRRRWILIKDTEIALASAIIDPHVIKAIVGLILKSLGHNGRKKFSFR